MLHLIDRVAILIRQPVRLMFPSPCPAVIDARLTALPARARNPSMIRDLRGSGINARDSKPAAHRAGTVLDLQP